MRWIILLAPALAGSLCLGCASTPDDVRGQNEAAQTGAAAAGGNRTKFGTEFGPISTFDLREGDCFDQSPFAAEPFEVLLVSCDGSWEFQVLNLLPLDNLQEWPGEAYFLAEVEARCDPATVWIFYPSEDSWFVGDRSFVCAGAP